MKSGAEGGFFIFGQLPLRDSPGRGAIDNVDIEDWEPKKPKPIHKGKDYTPEIHPRKYNRYTVQMMSPDAIAANWHDIWDFYERQS
jgi:hypothetical protein